MPDLNRMSATALAAAIRAGDASPTEVIDAYIERAEMVHPHINAIVAERFEAARSEAQRLEASGVPDKNEVPFAGVPFTVTESIAVAGMPHTAGSVERAGTIAEQDATVVARLRHAGAIPIGVSNPSEMGFWIEANNLVYGRTNNPHNRRRTSGGSCGGDAAAVAVGAAAFALGADGNGSIRVPAAFCGVVGMRPSSGLAPTTGYAPTPIGKRLRHINPGFVTRSSDDLMGLFASIQGSDQTDASVRERSLRHAADINFKWKRIVVCDDLQVPGLWPSADVKRGIERAVQALSDVGGDVEEWRPQQFDDVIDIWLSMTYEAMGLEHSLRTQLGNGKRIDLARELPRALIGRTRHTSPVLLMTLLERVTKGAYARIQRGCAEGRRLADRINRVLADDGVLLMPVYPHVAPKHGHTKRNPAAIVYSGLFSVLDLPSVAVPVGHDRSGMPLSVQIVAAHGREDVCAAAAQVVERALGPARAPALRALR